MCQCENGLQWLFVQSLGGASKLGVCNTSLAESITMGNMAIPAQLVRLSLFMGDTKGEVEQELG